jgi:hypothetical protein
VLFNILIEFGVCTKLVRLIKTSLYETCSNAPTDKHLCEIFSIHNGINKEMFYYHCFSATKVQGQKVGLNLNVTHQFLAQDDYVNLQGDNTVTSQKNRNLN